MSEHRGNVKGNRLPPEFLTDEEAEAIVKACSRRGAAGVRNRALILVLWRAGLRITEALNLKPSDVDLNEGTLRVLQGKGGKARTVGFPQSVGDALTVWMEKRKSLGIGPRKPLFCGISKTNLGKGLDSSYFRHLFPRLAKKAGITKRVHPHGFRHSCAVRLLRKGQNAGIISKALGHSDIAVTARYLDDICPADVVEAMRED